ncbi:MAG: phosphoribosylamine--glycine ligase [Alphaproteobacteria bacterium]|nr:phosphoribosylamine--glycine ligase [Alphaproteobacteria bacterium]
MKILLVGSGGREHALAWRLKKSQSCQKLYCAPGNAGIAEQAECVDIQVSEIDKIVEFARDKIIDLVVVGPENPLVDGLADKLRAENIPVFGPSKAAAQLEGSKGFMKDLVKKYNIPTAAYGRFTDLEEAKAFIHVTGAPIVVKTDGLAAGKGVIICNTKQQAEAAAEEMLSGAAFGDAGTEIVIEEFLEGEELSYFALADGKTILPLTSAQDHKRVGDGDTGPNTGGMGAYSPAHIMTEELEQEILDKIIQPTIDGMKAEGCPFTGVLFAGIMVCKGKPILLEHNVRFGDPECQTLMMRMDCDLAHILMMAAQGKLKDVQGHVNWSDDPALCVVMAAKGYPGDYEKNTLIQDIDKANEIEGVYVFHAGTKAGEDGKILSNGGRVLGVTAMGESIAQAQERAYKAVDLINWPEGFCRRDIAWRALKAKDEAA